VIGWYGIYVFKLYLKMVRGLVFTGQFLASLNATEIELWMKLPRYSVPLALLVKFC